MPELLIKNGLVVDPVLKRETKLDILTEGGKVTRCGASIAARGRTVFDAGGMWVFPGFIDMHVHAREPGAESSETMASAARAAAAGGVTSMLLMPNTSPAMDSPALVRKYCARARQFPVNLYLSAAVTSGRAGGALAPMAALKKAGAIAFTDDGTCVADDGLFQKALKLARKLGLPLLDHPELPGQGAGEAEVFAVLRDIMLASGRGPVHLQHLSLAGSVDALRLAKKAGLPVTGETCPHYFTLIAGDNWKADPDFKMNPPLRSAADRAAVLAGLADGTIDVIATDHAPHERALKAKGFSLAPNGIIGLETLAPLCITELVLKGRVSRLRLAELTSLNPARLLGLDRKGGLRPGYDADITVLDPRRARRVPDTFFSLSSNSPFKGRLLKGWPAAVIAGGGFVYRDGRPQFC